MSKNSKNAMLDANSYYTLAGIVFAFVFLLHGSRVLSGWEVFIGNWAIPMWISYMVVILSAYLTYHSFLLKK